MSKRWLSKSESTGEWQNREQFERRATYLAACEEIRQIWDRRIASRGGPLPGATLDPFITPRGWYGHVQVVIDLVDKLDWDGRRELANTVAEVYGLPRGAVLVGEGWREIGDTAFIWAYERPGVVDYHERLPYTVFGKEWAGKEPVPGHLTELERGELKSWAHKHRQMLDALHAGRYVDMEQVSRRYNRMRAAILDALTRASVDEVREMLIEQKLDYGSLGEDIGELLGMEPHRYL